MMLNVKKFELELNQRQKAILARCERLEIAAVRDALEQEEKGQRPLLPVACETCEPESAHFWSVYGRLKSGCAVWLEDFATEEEARAFREGVLAAWPHLREAAPD